MIWFQVKFRLKGVFFPEPCFYAEAIFREILNLKVSFQVTHSETLSYRIDKKNGS